MTQTVGKPMQLVCSEVWGGNRPIHAPVELPGLSGVLYSQPCDGGRGGDVHYLSVCGSGILSRVCLADVAGHGETVAAIGSEMHSHLRRCMNQFDQRRVLAKLNKRLEALGLHAMTTAAAVTYYPPSRTLSVSYAGHPPGWYFSNESRTWSRLTLDARTAADHYIDLPLAISTGVHYTSRKLRAEMGDRFLLITDGVLEAPGSNGRFFGEEGVEEVLSASLGADCDTIADALLSELQRHCGNTTLTHDDVSFVLIEIVPGPPEPHLWLALRNRLIRPRGNAPGPAFASVDASASAT
jgi:serine phosphatase RsbU (regulator of sigma subunit)